MGGRFTLLGALVASLLAGSARAEAPAPALGWVPLPGAESCIGPLELARLVEARLGSPALEAPSRAALSIEGHVGEAEQGGFQALVEVFRLDDGVVARHRLHSPDPDCRKLDGPVSLLIALAIDSEAVLPELIDDGGLSAEARELLAMLGLPADDADAALARLAPGRAPSAAARTQPPRERVGPRRAPVRATPRPRPGMVLVSSQELQRLRRLERTAPEPEPPLPRWPGHLMLVGGSVLTVVAIWTGVVADDFGTTQIALGTGAFLGVAGFLVWNLGVVDEAQPRGRSIALRSTVTSDGAGLQLRGRL